MGQDMLHSQYERSKPSLRPVMRGASGMISSGHQLATLAGLRILEGGGNAIDAGVAAGICLGVLQTDMVNFGGVAPIMIHDARDGKVSTVNGLGRWPRSASVAYFREHCGGLIPPGILRSIVPAAPDAWITALRQFGTLTFAEVSRDAIELALRGFPMHHFMANNIREEESSYREYPSNVAVYLPRGRPPEVGEMFVQTKLGETLQRMAEAERKQGSGSREAAGAGHSSREAGGAGHSSREAGLLAARDEFYTGGIARDIVAFHQSNGGLMTPEDLASFTSGVEEAPSVTYGEFQVFGCGAWCQGPSLLEALNILEGCSLRAMGHNSPEYVHTLTEAFKLAFADREAFIGDPGFVRVPLAGLLSKAYARVQRERIDPAQAWGEMPAPGDPWAWEPDGPGAKAAGSTGAPGHGGGETPSAEGGPLSAAPGETGDRWDTSYVAVMDRWGNAFSATPSDTPSQSPLIPELGILCSSRGSQSWVDERHPSSVEGGKRPRLTPAPAFVMRGGQPYLAFGTPGGDVQIQAMTQVFLNLVEFGMDLQEAVEAPRFATYNYPGSFAPHAYNPGLFRAESRIGEAVLRRLAELGNRVEPWEDYSWRGGGVCAVRSNPEHGILEGAADPRRECYAMGW